MADKSIFYFFLFTAQIFYAQTQEKNYSQSSIFQYPYTQTEVEEGNFISDNVKQTVTYFDGIGRPQQTIIRRSGISERDLVLPSYYDVFGRMDKEYLPYPVTNNDGQYINGAVNEQNQFYLNRFPSELNLFGSSNPYYQKRFENSPLDRVLESGMPGKDWQVHLSANFSHTLKLDYQTNDNDNIYNFSVDFSNGNTAMPELTFNGWHAHGSIRKLITKNENWVPGDNKFNTTEEYTNSLGQVILKRTFNEFGTSQQVLNTYYVYDEFGNLTFVLSPEASKSIIDTSGSPATLRSNYQTLLDELGYQYTYDKRNRVSSKKIAGKGWERIIYDRMDRPILTQDDNLKNDSNKWFFTKYDSFGRVAYSGIYDNPFSRSQAYLQTEAESATALYYDEKIKPENDPELVGSTILFYTNRAFPTIGLDVWVINYYDEYVDSDGMTLSSNVFGINPNTTETKGLPTVNRTRILESSGDFWNTTIMGYDNKGRLIYNKERNQYLTIDNTTKLSLDFTGKTIESHVVHSKTGLSSITIRDYYSYDNLGRPLQHSQKIDNEPIQLISDNVYNDLGELSTKYIGGQTLVDGYTGLENVDVTPTGTIVASTGDWGFPSVALTKGEIPSNTDGFVKATVLQDNQHVKIGFVRSNNTSQPGAYFDYGLYTFRDSNGNNYVRLTINSTVASGNYGGYNVGDTFRVEREGSYINFYRNNDQLHSIYDPSTVPNAGLIGKVSFSGFLGNSVENFKIFSPELNKKLQNVNYRYNIRGWLTDINNVDFNPAAPSAKGPKDLFHFRINYNELEGGYTNNDIVPLYNGNISETIWKSESQDKTKRSYGYMYDDLNRIRIASSRKGIDLTTNDVHNLWNVSYDLNGNIKTLRRSGITAGQYYDDLGYTYETVNGVKTNRLINVKDGGFDIANCPNPGDCSGFENGFVDGNDPSNTLQADYEYDPNGNLTRDRNKSITSIEYNELNLPTLITIDNGVEAGTIEYVYDAVGNKLEKRAVIDFGIPIVTNYVGNFVYSNMGTTNMDLQFIKHSEGYIEPTVNNPGKSVKGFDDSSGTTTYSDYNYVFQYKDHLGNIRLSYWDKNLDGSIDETDEIIQESNYYPFGLKQKGYNNVLQGGNDLAQNFKYQGKELNEELDLDWYDFGARNYDAALGRWMNVDPLAEDFYSYSPYNAMMNDPIGYIDPDGRSAEWVPGTDGKAITYSEDANGNLTVSENATADTQQIVAGINESGSETAKSQFKGVADSEGKVNLVVNKTDTGANGKSLFGLHQAHDANGNALNWDSSTNTFDGEVDTFVDSNGNTVYTEATITIFESNFNDNTQNKFTALERFGIWDSGLTKSNAMSGTFSHEVFHNLDQKTISTVKQNSAAGKKVNGYDVEAPAYKVQGQVHQEMKDNRQK